ncbi:MAG: acetyl-CoA acetyltransferase [Gemmatimonadota bacterium]|nr:MAG: acetyl-CoA acetyltransferase [Gemmatimonadota bacterium]
MPTPVILGAVRTPMVRAGEDFRSVPAKELGRRAVQELIDGAGVTPEQVDEIILGNAGTPANAPNIARVVGLMAGLPESVPGLTVHRNCASGMEAIQIAADKVAAGSAGLIVAGGTENMSQIPMQLPPEANPWFVRWAKARTPARKLAALRALDWQRMMPRSALLEGLTDPVCGLSMGRTAEILAREFGITREDQDAYALRSHQRASSARERGRFGPEIAPLFIGPDYRKVVTEDIGPREQQSLEALAKLRPVFERRDGTVTAGNSCQITDGAAAVLVSSEEWAASHGFRPLARIRGHATCGLSPSRMGLGPALAIPVALDRAGTELSDMDRVEINEAFAAQVIACVHALGSDRFAQTELGRMRAPGEIPPDKLNPNGGAIALGHPIGATGARLVVTLLAELVDADVAMGVASLCVGGGQGSAIVLERAA